MPGSGKPKPVARTGNWLNPDSEFRMPHCQIRNATKEGAEFFTTKTQRAFLFLDEEGTL
jgi:hypothetical protein